MQIPSVKDRMLAATIKNVRSAANFFGIEVSRYQPVRPPVDVRRNLYVPKEFSDNVDRWCGGFKGKRVLEVGCDLPGKFSSQIAELYAPAEMIGINPLVQPRVVAPNCRFEKGDIRSTRFADADFDVIVSSSAFEHIHNFDVALAEMYRLLKPGGYLYSTFGPIWSTSYGHHLWVTRDQQNYTYWNVILPPFCHLLSTPGEIAAFLHGKHPPDLCEQIGEYVCHSTDQNQLFFEDYERIVRDSAFKMIFFKGVDQPELADKYIGNITLDTFRQLEEKFPGKKNFLFDGIVLLLQKPA